MSDFQDVLAFHVKFGLPMGNVPTLMPEDAEKFRLGFLYEEAEEYEEAYNGGNIVKAADALLDLVYVAYGTALFIGCPRIGEIGIWPVFDEVENGVFRSGLHGNKMKSMSIPRVLPIGLHMFTAARLRSQVDMFKLAYESAKQEEVGGLELSLMSLKSICTSAYMAAAMMLVPWERCWQHVQAANMSKVRAKADGSDSKRSTPWDVVKPAGWKAPDAKIAMELQLSGWKVPAMMLVDNLTGKVELP